MLTSQWGTGDSQWGNITYGEGAPVVVYDAVDTLTITDKAESSGSFGVSAEDSLTLTDVAVEIVAVLETLTLSDEASLITVTKGIVDTLVLSEQAAFTGGSFLSGFAKDDMYITEEGETRWTRQFQVSETLVLDEGVVATPYTPCVDTLVLSETVEGIDNRAAVDFLTIDDKLELRGRIYVDAVDYLSLYEVADGNALRDREAVDTLAIYEERKVNFNYYPEAEDTLFLAERALPNVVVVEATDDLVLDEDVELDVLSRSAAAVDSLVLTENDERLVTYVRVAEDTLLLSELTHGARRTKGFAIFPYKEDETVLRFELPEPESGNMEHSTNSFNLYRTAQGKNYTYVRRNFFYKRYTYSFILRYEKALALQRYLWGRGQQPPSPPPQFNLYLYYRFRGELYRGKVANNPIRIVGIDADNYRVELVFEGVKLNNLGGRSLSCAAS